MKLWVPSAPHERHFRWPGGRTVRWMVIIGLLVGWVVLMPGPVEACTRTWTNATGPVRVTGHHRTGLLEVTVKMRDNCNFGTCRADWLFGWDTSDTWVTLMGCLAP